VPAADPFATEERRRDRHHDGRHPDDERAVRDARQRDTADEEQLVRGMTHETEPDERQTVAGRQRLRCVQDARRRVTAPACAPPHDPNGREEQRRRDREAQGVEGLWRDLVETALDDAVVRAPDDDHQDEERVDPGHSRATAGVRAA